MTEFVVKLENKFKVKAFLTKLNMNFKTINSKNILLTRSMFYTENNKDIYAVFKIKPVVPNIPFYVSALALLLFTAFLFIFNKQINTLLVMGLISILMAFAWTPTFFYLLLKRSMKKNNITNVELL
jgi:hypothetical protein